MKISKIIIDAIELIDWDSFCFDSENNVLFICNSDNFPLIKYRIPLDRHNEYDGQSEKFDIQRWIGSMDCGDPSVVMENIPNKGWLTLSMEALSQAELGKYCSLMLLELEDNESIPSDVIFETNRGSFHILANNLNMVDFDIKNNNAQFAIALYFG